MRAKGKGKMEKLLYENVEKKAEEDVKKEEEELGECGRKWRIVKNIIVRRNGTRKVNIRILLKTRQKKMKKRNG